jgi:hypothetical protein
MKFHHGAMLCAWLSTASLFFACDQPSAKSHQNVTASVAASSSEMMETEQPEENGTCSACNGSGTNKGCSTCRNQGWQRCDRCNGSRDDGYDNPGCEKCYSEGKIACDACQGAGAEYVGKCLRCNGSGKTTFIDCNNCDNGKSSPKVQVLGVCVLCEGKGRVEIPAS